jgi:hypothetical protein
VPIRRTPRHDGYDQSTLQQVEYHSHHSHGEHEVLVGLPAASGATIGGGYVPPGDLKAYLKPALDLSNMAGVML